MKVTALIMGINSRCAQCGELVEIEVKPDLETKQPVWWVTNCEKCQSELIEERDDAITGLNDLESQLEDFDY